MTALEHENAIWDRAAHSQTAIHTIYDPHVEQLDQVLRRCADLSRNDRGLSRALWMLRLAVSQTLLPFSAQELGLKEMARPLLGAPELRAHRMALDEALQTLLTGCANPKLSVLEQVFCESDDTICVWNRPWNQPPCGWPEALAILLDDEFGDRVRVLGSIRALPEHGGRLLLVSPLHGWRFPPAAAVKLMRPGRWAAVHVLRYDIPLEDDEFTRSAVGPRFPEEFWFAKSEVRDIPTGPPRPSIRVEQLPEVPAPDGMHYLFPGEPGDPQSGEPVASCTILFTSGHCVAYANDEHIRLLNRQERWVPVIELSEGDLVPVATDEADQDSLRLGACARLGATHIAQLKLRMAAWKNVVRACLNRHGEAALRARYLSRVARNAEPWRSDAWTGETPWGPRSRDAFQALITAVHEFGFFRDQQDITSVIHANWADMQLLRNAHRQAGRELASNLREELEREIERRSHWQPGDEVLGDGGRRYRVFEVSGVCDAGALYPNQLQRLRKWQG